MDGPVPLVRSLGVPLAGRRVVLERVGLRHMPQIHAILSADGVAGSWPLLGAPVERHELASYLGSLSRIQFTIVRRDSGEPIGLVQAIDEDARCGTADVGVVVTESLWRAGWPLEALVLFADYMFRGMAYRKLYFSMAAGVASRVAGYVDELLTRECTLTAHVRVGDCYEDLLIYSLHRRDWDAAGMAVVTGNG